MSIQFLGKISCRFGFYPENTFFSRYLVRSEKSSISQNTPLTSTKEGRRGRRRAPSRAHRQRPLCFFWRRRLASYHSQLILSGRRKPMIATHGTTTTMQQSKFLSFSSASWIDLVLPVALCRSSWWGKIACDHQVFC